METGKYYAAIVLLKDFSASLVESVTGTSKQPKIKYYVNEKKNAIAPKSPTPVPPPSTSRSTPPSSPR